MEGDNESVSRTGDQNPGCFVQNNNGSVRPIDAQNREYDIEDVRIPIYHLQESEITSNPEPQNDQQQDDPGLSNSDRKTWDYVKDLPSAVGMWVKESPSRFCSLLYDFVHWVGTWLQKLRDWIPECVEKPYKSICHFYTRDFSGVALLSFLANILTSKYEKVLAHYILPIFFGIFGVVLFVILALYIQGPVVTRLTEQDLVGTLSGQTSVDHPSGRPVPGEYASSSGQQSGGDGAPTTAVVNTTQSLHNEEVALQGPSTHSPEAQGTTEPVTDSLEAIPQGGSAPTKTQEDTQTSGGERGWRSSVTFRSELQNGQLAETLSGDFSSGECKPCTGSFIEQIEIEGDSKDRAKFKQRLEASVAKITDKDPHSTVQLDGTIFFKTAHGIQGFKMPEEILPVVDSVKYETTALDVLRGVGGDWVITGSNLKHTVVSIANDAFKLELKPSIDQIQINKDIITCKEPGWYKKRRLRSHSKVFITAVRRITVRERSLELRSTMVDTYGPYWRGVLSAFLSTFLPSSLRTRLRELCNPDPLMSGEGHHHDGQDIIDGPLSLDEGVATRKYKALLTAKADLQAGLDKTRTWLRNFAPVDEIETVRSSDSFVSQVKIEVNAEEQSRFLKGLRNLIEDISQTDLHFTVQLGNTIFLKTDQGVEGFRLPHTMFPEIDNVSYSTTVSHFIKGFGGKWIAKGRQLENCILSIANDSYKVELKPLKLIQIMYNNKHEIICEEPAWWRRKRSSLHGKVYISVIRRITVRGKTLELRSRLLEIQIPYWKGVFSAFLSLVSWESVQPRATDSITNEERCQQEQGESSHDETKTKLVDDSEVDRQAQKFEEESKTELAEDSLHPQTQIMRINDSVYSLYEPADPNAELVFFHGIAQESHEACKDMHLKAWMSSSGEIWPAEWLHKEAKFRRARILSVDYTYSQGLLFFNEMENLALDLINADVGQRDRPVVLVGHDVGGLVIKEICVYLEAKAKHCGAENVRSFWSRKCEDFLKHLRGVFYFSVPHLGLQIADSTDLNGEEFMRVQNRNARINEQFSKIRSKRRWTTAGLAHLLEDRDGSIRIPEGSLRFDMDIFMMERKSREEINKPDSPYSSGFQYFVSCVTGFLQGEVDEDGNEKFGSGDEDLAEVGSRVDEVGRKVDGLPSLSSSVKKARQILKETETKLDFELDRQGGHLEEETKTDSELSLVCDSVLDHQSQKFEETSESSAAVQERIVELTSTSASRSAQRLRPYTDYGVEKLTDNLYDLSSTTCEKGKENAVVIFFHGLELDDSANPDETWLRTWTFRDNPAVCWPPQMFSTDKLLQENNVVVRAYASKYDANKYRTRNSGRLNLYLFAENVLETVIPRVMRSTEIQIPIFLVAHGFGGFVIQELIEHAFKKTRRVSSDPFAKRFLQCLGGILFYAVPFNSLKQDTYDTIFGHGQQTLAEPGEMLSQFNKELIRSREIFKRNINSIVGDPSNGLRSGAEIRIKAAFEIHETDMEHWKGVIVVEGGVHPAAEIVIIEADHLSICRPLSGPDGYTEAQYTCLQELIVDVVKAERLRYANQGNNLLKAFQPSSPTEIVTKEKTDETCHPYSSPAKVTLEEVDLVKLKTFQPSSPREKIVMEEKTDETFQPSSSPEIGTVKEADIDTLETNQPSSLTEKNTKEKTNETFQPSTPASEIVEENNDRVTEDNNYPTERLELHFHMHQQVVIIVNPRLPKFTGIPVW